MAKMSESQLKELFEQACEAKYRGGSLSKVFTDFAKKTGRAKGSVRNVYYSSLKQMKSDKKYMDKMLGENKLDVAKIISFEDSEADLLLEKILIGVTFGKSVRRVINEATDNPKLALRYQNKYRNLLKLEKDRVNRIRQNIINEYGKCYDPYKQAFQEDEAYEKLKREINGLCERIAVSTREENKRLKHRIAELEKENKILEEKLAKNGDGSVMRFFEGSVERTVR